MKKIVIFILKIIFYVKNFFLKAFNFKKKIQLRVLLIHNIKKKDFKKFNLLLSEIKKTFDFIDYSEFKLILNNKKKIFNNKILLSFDDGYLSQYQVKAIFQKYNIKPIYFITYGFAKIKSSKKLSIFSKKNLRLENLEEVLNLNISHLKKIKKYKFDIASHTLTHPNLTKIDKVMLKDELTLSKKYLNKTIGSKISDAFAYPFGGMDFINPYLLKEISKYYKYIFSGIRGNNFDLLNKKKNFIFRDNSDLNHSISDILFYINGGLDLFYKIKLKMRKLL